MLKSGRFLERFSPDYLERFWGSRAAKAEKILRILRREVAEPHQSSLIDIGCSQGRITRRLADEFGFVVGVEMDREARQQDNRFQFVQGDGCCLPVLSSSFDVVLLNHVLDHVSSPQQLLDEAWRVLKPGGVCYLAVPNRFILMEPHYLLPFLSWLPRPLANLYVRLAGRGTAYLDNMPSYRTLGKLTRRFCVEDQTVLVFKHPESFFPDDPKLTAQARWSHWIPDWFVRLLLPVFPVWILILRKAVPVRQPAASRTKP